nr:MAG TPA: hypothetical protein [Caudoviricetes sp.]
MIARGYFLTGKKPTLKGGGRIDSLTPKDNQKL